MRVWFVRVALAAGLVASAPAALGQKLNKCPDGKGGTVFQQEKCAETADQAEARNKERARIEAEAQRNKEEAARRKEESVQKAQERDKAYQDQMKGRAEEQKKSREADQRMGQAAAGTSCNDALALLQSFSAASTSSSIFFASPNSIRLFSL